MCAILVSCYTVYSLIINCTYVQLNENKSKQDTSRFWKDNEQDRVLQIFQNLTYWIINSYIVTKSDARFNDGTPSLGNSYTAAWNNLDARTIFARHQFKVTTFNWCTIIKKHLNNKELPVLLNIAKLCYR
jgi:hypothetical protein